MKKKINPDHLNIQVDTKESRLYLTIEDNQDAELHYKLNTDKNPTEIEFTDTFVPETLRNVGIGSKLAERGMRLAKANNYQVRASCPFVESYINKHPEFKENDVPYAT